jgi:hypothetical protein
MVAKSDNNMRDYAHDHHGGLPASGGYLRNKRQDCAGVLFGGIHEYGLNGSRQ